MAKDSREDPQVSQNVHGGQGNKQAAGDYHETHNYYTAGPETTSPEPEEPHRSLGKGFGGLGLVGFILFVVISQCSGGNGTNGTQAGARPIPFVEPGDPWPAGASKEQITFPIVSKLVSCAKATVVNPLTCPNTTSDSEPGISNVHWELIGDDPGDEAAISFHGTQADVIGHVVMTVSYIDDTGPKFKLEKLQYRATVDWNNGNPQLATPIDPTKVTPKKSIIATKPPSSEAWRQVEPSLRRAFNKCVTSRTIPMPPTCPRNPDTDSDLGSVRWSFDGDPLLNTASTYDPAWGLIHVKGNFAFNFTYNVLFFGSDSDSRHGVYDAVLAATGRDVRVLEIVEK